MNIGCSLLANLVLFLIVNAVFGVPGVAVLAILALMGIYAKVEIE